MITDIENFIKIIRLKNGKIKIKHDKTNEENIYKLLHDYFHFRKTKIKGKKVYYCRENNKLKKVSLDEIKYTFFRFLVEEDYTNCPNDVSNDDIQEWYLASDSIIKENTLLNKHLKEELNANDTHYLRLQIDPFYKNSYEINQLIAKLKEWRFTKTIDKINTPKGTPLIYYKKVKNNTYIVLRHSNRNKNKIHICEYFDCFLETHQNKQKIGIKEPIYSRNIKLGFDPEYDFYLIEQYINNSK